MAAKQPHHAKHKKLNEKKLSILSTALPYPAKQTTVSENPTCQILSPQKAQVAVLAHAADVRIWSCQYCFTTRDQTATTSTIMSSLVYKYFLQKTALDHVVAMGPEEDPYHETIPEEELHFYQRKGARRKRKLPDFIPKHDLKVLNSVKRKAYRLDLQLSLCGIRIGWAGLIGLIPGIGDVIALYFALRVLRKAQQIEGGLPPWLHSKMMANIAFDFGIGLIPVVGDFINILYKCNSRNFVLLEKHLVEKYSKERPVDPSKAQPPPPPPRQLEEV